MVAENEKSKELKNRINNDKHSSMLKLHKEAITVERERSVKYVLKHFLELGILDESDYERYLNIFLHDLDS